MLPFGLFLVFQAYPRMKITHVLMSLFFTYSVFGSGIPSATDLSSAGIEIVKVVGGGAVVAVGTFYWNWIGFSILGMMTGLLPTVVFLQQFTDGSTMTSYQSVNFPIPFLTLITFILVSEWIPNCLCFYSLRRDYHSMYLKRVSQRQF